MSEDAQQLQSNFTTWIDQKSEGILNRRIIYEPENMTPKFQTVQAPLLQTKKTLGILKDKERKQDRTTPIFLVETIKRA
jgi:hypothetical protein